MAKIAADRLRYSSRALADITNWFGSFKLHPAGTPAPSHTRARRPRRQMSGPSGPFQVGELDLLTYLLTLLPMCRSVASEQKSVHGVGEGGGLLEGVFDMMFEEMHVHTCPFSRALFLTYISKRGNALVGEGDWGGAGGAAAKRSLDTPEGSPPLS